MCVCEYVRVCVALPFRTKLPERTDVTARKREREREKFSNGVKLQTKMLIFTG